MHKAKCKAEQSIARTCVLELYSYHRARYLFPIPSVLAGGRAGYPRLLHDANFVLHVVPGMVYEVQLVLWYCSDAEYEEVRRRVRGSTWSDAGMVWVDAFFNSQSDSAVSCFGCTRHPRHTDYYFVSTLVPGTYMCRLLLSDLFFVTFFRTPVGFFFVFLVLIFRIFLVWLVLLCSRTRYASSSLALPWLIAIVLFFLSHKSVEFVISVG